MRGRKERDKIRGRSEREERRIVVGNIKERDRDGDEKQRCITLT